MPQERYDHREFEVLETDVERARWMRVHRKVRESSKLKRNVSTGDSTAGGSALATVRNYRPQTGPRVLRADQLRKGMVVSPVGKGGRFTVDTLVKAKGRATLVNGRAYPAHVGFRIVDDVARPAPKRKVEPQRAPEPITIPVRKLGPVPMSTKPDMGLRPDPDLTIRPLWERDKRCGITWPKP